MALTEMLPDECMAGTFRAYGGVALAVTIAGFLAAAVSLAKALAWLRDEAHGRRYGKAVPDRHTLKARLLTAWVLLPPAWLYTEAIFLYRRFGKAACFASFQHAQNLVLHGWIVVVAVLFVICFGREIFGKE